jgi:hypothetical protein
MEQQYIKLGRETGIPQDKHSIHGNSRRIGQISLLFRSASWKMQQLMTCS